MPFLKIQSHRNHQKKNILFLVQGHLHSNAIYALLSPSKFGILKAFCSAVTPPTEVTTLQFDLPEKGKLVTNVFILS